MLEGAAFAWEQGGGFEPTGLFIYCIPLGSTVYSKGIFACVTPYIPVFCFLLLGSECGAFTLSYISSPFKFLLIYLSIF